MPKQIEDVSFVGSRVLAAAVPDRKTYRIGCLSKRQPVGFRFAIDEGEYLWDL